MREGMINVLKPAGMTSHNAVSFLRRLTGVKRIGHTGTLDPMAAGVLTLGIGTAARAAEYLDLDEKKYRCELMLGISTDTLDIWGAVTVDRRDRLKGISERDVLSSFEPLRGNIMQLPPQYSALKVNGKRLYEYARKGQTVEISRRPVAITDLEIVDMDLTTGRVCFDVSCSKGTYVRSLCQEVGEYLGCGAAMSFLLRTASGAAALENSVTLEELADKGDQIWDYVKDIDFYLPSLGRLVLRRGREAWFSNGGYLTAADAAVDKLPFSEELKRDEHGFQERASHIGGMGKLADCYLVYGADLNFMGTAVWNEEQKKYNCDKVFNR